jgi:cytochrome P450
VLDVPEAAAAASLELIVYYLDLVNARRSRREDDLTSALLDVDIDGEHLTDEELCAFLFLMVVAGNETTTKLLGNAWYWANEHPEQKRKAFDGALMPWVDETLRFDASSQVLARTVAQDTELYGQGLAKGDRLLLLIGAANRDERVFTDPDRYDLDRDTTALLSFGNGTHFCLGASLARLETKVVLEELVGLVRAYDIDPNGTERVHSVNVRGFAHLPTNVVRR